MSVFSRAFKRLGNLFKKKPEKIETKPKGKIPIKVIEKEKPLPIEKYFEVVLHRTMTRGGKSRPNDKDRIEVRVTVKAKDSDEATHTALRAIGSRVPDGYIQFFERIGIYNNISVVERTPGEESILLIRHSGGEIRGTDKW